MLKAEGLCRTGLDCSGHRLGHRTQPHFAEAARMLGRERNPQRGIQDQWLQAAAEHMGVGETYGATYQGISFADCIACGQCITGCPHGAKNSTDLTYLAQGRGSRRQILALSKAHILVPVHDGWRVVVRNPLTQRVSSVEAKEVVVAAGVLGTVELLSACRDRWKTLPELSSMLGRRVRTNSEAFSAILHPPGTDVTHRARSPATSTRTRTRTSRITVSRSPTDSCAGTSAPWSAVTGGARPCARCWPSRRWPRPTLGRRTGTSASRSSRSCSADNEMALSYRKGPLGWALRSEIPAGVDPVPVSPEADAAGRGGR